MPFLQADDMADMVAGTLKELGRLRFNQIIQELADYEIMPRWFKKMRKTDEGGIGIQRNLMIKSDDVAKHVGWYHVDDTNVADHMIQISIPWVTCQTDWAMEHKDTLVNKGKAVVFNVIKPRRINAMISMVQLLETHAWASPALADTHLPFGVFYYIVYNASEGFNGDVPTGHTTVAGVTPSDHGSRYMNYTAQFTDVTRDDLIAKWTKAQWLTNWKSPVTVKDYRGANGSRYRWYMHYDTAVAIATYAEQQNENLGKDVASMDGRATFLGHPIVRIHAFDDLASGSEPIVGIDHSCFETHVLAGDYLRETPSLRAGNQHNVYRSFVDLTYNYLCTDRRRQIMIAKADPTA